MQYNPQYCTIVVRNTDGSGYLRQFKTLAEAKDAYASISASGASVYLYQPPTRSLASFEAGEGIPDYNNGTTYGTGDKVKFQGKVYQLINFIGAAGYDPAAYANLWTEVTSFTPPSIPPISSTASPVVENGVTRNPFTFNEEENSNPTKMTKVGCEIVQETEADGNLTFCAIYPKYRYTLQDGTVISEELGEKNTNGCYYPAGFKIKFLSFGESFREVKILNSLDFGGTVYGPYYQVDTYMGSENAYEVADGSGGKVTQVFISVREKQGDLYVDRYFQDGDTPYKTSDASFSSGIWMEAGQPIPNGNYLVTYKVTGDERIHSGIWNVSIENADSSPRGKWVFTPQEPDQPPPPPCSILRKVTNPITGSVEDECDPDVVYPFTVEENCEPPVTVDLEGQTITLGTNKKTGMDNGYGDVVWGPCSGMIYVPNATLILSGESLNYFSDGQGSYYTEDKNPNPCDSAGTVISSEQTDITVQINGSTYTVGYSYERTVADGNCGSTVEVGSEYVPSGTEITQDETNIYYSDGAGGYYAEPIVNCDAYGTFISSSNTGSATVYVSELNANYAIGETVENTYADGSCGSYTESVVNYYSSGTQIASDSTSNYLSNGTGGYYSEPITNCDSYGTYVSGENTGDLTVYVSELLNSYTVGNTYNNTYADGSCGTYTESGSNYYSYGTQIASDGTNYNFFSDGNGGYYSEPIQSCDTAGTYISSNSGNSEVYIIEIGSYYVLGTYIENIYADGNCGTYGESSNEWYPYGTNITNANGYNFFSNGSGGYYSESDGTGGGGGGCDSYGTYISGTSSDATIYISELQSYYTGGTYTESVYADGSCGTYTEGSTSWSSYGTFITSDGSNNYYTDGSGSYYIQLTNT